MTASVLIGKPGVDAWVIRPGAAECSEWHPVPVEQGMIARTPGQLWERVRA